MPVGASAWARVPPPAPAGLQTLPVGLPESARVGWVPFVRSRAGLTGMVATGGIGSLPLPVVLLERSQERAGACKQQVVQWSLTGRRRDGVAFICEFAIRDAANHAVHVVKPARDRVHGQL